MATLPESVVRALISKRFESFTAAPIHIIGAGNDTFDPSLQEYLNGSTDTPAGPQPVAATWTVENVRETYGYVQLTVEILEAGNLGLTSGLVGGSFTIPEILRATARFVYVSPVGNASLSVGTDTTVEEIFRKIRVLYERAALTDSAHADWPLLQVLNYPLNGEGSPWRVVLERDESSSWRLDRMTGEFETSPVLRPYASAPGTPIEVTL